MRLASNPIGILQTGAITSSDTSAAVPLSENGSGAGAAGFSVSCNVTVTSPVTGCSVKLQASLDKSTWQDIDDSASTITASTTVFYNYRGPMFEYFRVVYTIASGALSVDTRYVVKRSI